MANNFVSKSFKLLRADGKIVEAVFYDNSGINTVDVLNIKNLKFEGKKTKDITKLDIRNVVFKGADKLYLQNNKSKIVALLPKKHLTKIISTIFTRDIESRHTYLKKEIISNVDTIFYAAIPILKHPELKSEILYNCQIIHRFALPLSIGSKVFLTMITLKERLDNKESSIDEFTIYDLYSQVQENKKPFGSSSTASAETSSVTTRSQYQMDTFSITDLVEFVKGSMTKIQ